MGPELLNYGHMVCRNVLSHADCQKLLTQADFLTMQNAANEQNERCIFSTLTDETKRSSYFLNSADRISCFYEQEAFAADGDGVLAVSPRYALNKIGHALHRHDPVFNKFSYGPVVQRLLQDVAEMIHPVIVQSMFIFKWPGIGGEVKWHQDASYLYVNPNPSELIGLWFALEDATIENGCLWAIPQSSPMAIQGRLTRSDEDKLHWHAASSETGAGNDNFVWDEGAAIPLEVNAGDAIVFRGDLPHRGPANRSKKSRRSLVLHCMEQSAHFASDNWARPSQTSLHSVLY